MPKNSLRILETDVRDFSVGSIAPQINIKDVPLTDFVVSEPLVIKDQKETDYCSGYALTSVSEDQEGVELFPEYQFFKTKVVSGKFNDWGADLRDACKSATRFGSIPHSESTALNITSRDQIIDNSSWPSFLDEIAKTHRKEGYFKITGRYDTFDNIRCALWQYKKKKCTILTGALWRQSWLDAPGGIIPPIYENDGFGHAFKIFGQKVIAERLYLVAQLSQGKQVGDNGLFYLSREVVNQEIGPFGMFMFHDLVNQQVVKKEGFITSLIKKLYVRFFKKSL